jgi:hypothetical protein
VEDRTAPGLWIELASKGHDYGARARDLISQEGISSAWWGANANPGRKDLPRVLPEFATLGIYETDEGFVPPPTPEEFTGIHFRRTPRPGQGVLAGVPTTGVLLVLISPRSPEAATALRDWADFVHIRHIAEVAVPGYSMITPYENAGAGDPRYMHLYEMHTDDPETTFKSMRPLVEERLGQPGSPAFDGWAWHDQLKIYYVNTFSRLGVISP